jgi:hypothetical protein
MNLAPKDPLMNTENDLRFQLSLMRMMSRLTPPREAETADTRPQEEMEVLVSRLRERKDRRKKRSA